MSLQLYMAKATLVIVGWVRGRGLEAHAVVGTLVQTKAKCAHKTYPNCIPPTLAK